MSDAERQYVAEYARKAPSATVSGPHQMYASGAPPPSGDHIKVHQLNEGPGNSVGPSSFLCKDTEVMIILTVKKHALQCTVLVDSHKIVCLLREHGIDLSLSSSRAMLSSY